MNRDDLLAALSVKPVQIDAGGLPVFVKPMTVAELVEFAAARKLEPEKTPELLFVLAISDEQGNRPFAVADARAGIVSTVSGAVADAVVSWAVEVNRLGPGKASSDPARS